MLLKLSTSPPPKPARPNKQTLTIYIVGTDRAKKRWGDGKVYNRLAFVERQKELALKDPEVKGVWIYHN